MKDQHTLNTAYKLCQSVYFEENTIEQYKEKFNQFETLRPELNEFLKGKTVIILKGYVNQLGAMLFDSSAKKAKIIEKVVDRLESYFLLGRNVTWTMGESTEDLELKIIQGTTAEYLTEFYAKQKAEEEAEEKAIENPETRAEFHKFVTAKGFDALSDEQLEQYDKLRADNVLKQREERAEEATTVQRVDIKTAEFALHPTKHSKTGADIFTVVMTERVERDTFKELRIKAKKFGGYYSRYTDKRATPPVVAGFNFESESAARLFMGLTEQDQQSGEIQQERQEEKKLSATERMKASATATIEKATEKLNQERRTNTVRQAGQAASAEADARNEIRFSRVLISIADAIEKGEVKYLTQIRNKAQLSQLESLLNRAFSKRVTWAERERGAEKNPALDVRFVEFPHPVYWVENFNSILLKYQDTPGLKLEIKRALRAVGRPDEQGKFILKGEYNIGLFKSIGSKISDRWDKGRVLDQIKNLERMQNIGLTSDYLLRMALRELGELSAGNGESEEEKQAREMKEIERSFIGKKIDGFFPTPPDLIETMFSMARVFEGETVLEPSAGLGHIAEAIRGEYPENELDVVEVNYALCEALEKKKFQAFNMDFLQVEEVSYDVIFMNPPFEKHQDIDHVMHAYSLLKKGGRIVAVMAGNKKNSQQAKVNDFVEFVEDHGGYIIDNEAGAFKSAFRSTSVNTVTVYLEKPNN